MVIFIDEIWGEFTWQRVFAFELEAMAFIPSDAALGRMGLLVHGPSVEGQDGAVLVSKLR